MNDKEKKKEFLENAPEWVMGINSINEIAYGTEYLKQHPMICINDKLFDVDGEVDMKYVSYQISQDILPYIRSNLSNRVKSLIEAVKLLSYGSELPLDEFRIHLKNGTLDVDGTFTEEKYFCRNRLDVEYREFIGEAYYPEKFLTFLYDLLMFFAACSPFAGYKTFKSLSLFHRLPAAFAANVYFFSYVMSLSSFTCHTAE